MREHMQSTGTNTVTNLAPSVAAAGTPGCTVPKELYHHTHHHILLDHQPHMALVQYQVASSWLRILDPIQLFPINAMK